MIEFVLNNKSVSTNKNPGSTLLDFIRYEKRLSGTKIGCREGDCGACTLLLGELNNDEIKYKSLTSCITPLGNAHRKHVVTIEGLNQSNLTPYQQAMVDTSGTQCGMCTVGFIMSFAGLCLTVDSPSYDDVISAIDGNICRCTGYKSIERAAAIVVKQLQSKPVENQLDWLIKNDYIPAYFSSIAARLSSIEKRKPMQNGRLILGGGTDLLVQQHDKISESPVKLISNRKKLIGISRIDDVVHVKASTNTTDLLESPVMQDMIPNWYQYLKLVSSTPIRNIATVAGNIVNASPIGDLTAIFMVLNADVHVRNMDKVERTIPLNKLYTGYKQLDLETGEQLRNISFHALDKDTKFNFEKVSKRRYLDIATVNTAMSIRVVNDTILDVHISAGGVGPTPAYLENTRESLLYKSLNIDVVREALFITQKEISPISDVRGSEKYKRLLLQQLLFAHFIELFPTKFNIKELI